jgi:phage tail tape-measure protein
LSLMRLVTVLGGIFKISAISSTVNSFMLSISTKLTENLREVKKLNNRYKNVMCNLQNVMRNLIKLTKNSILLNKCLHKFIKNKNILIFYD